VRDREIEIIRLQAEIQVVKLENADSSDVARIEAEIVNKRKIIADFSVSHC
jgi:hypothetical protein